MKLHPILTTLVLLVGVAFSLASFMADPKLYAGANCCACLQTKGPDGQTVADGDYDSNCIPNDSEAESPCSEQVASQMVESETNEPILVTATACHEQHCATECKDAKDNGLTFSTEASQ